MAARTYPINLTDFRGGLNLRANEFTLAENESPDMLNVEVDPRAGVRTRKGWEKWNTNDVALAATWDPRHAFVHELNSGQDVLMVTNNGKVRTSTDGEFSTLDFNGASLDVGAGTHLADFAGWGDTVYGVSGADESSFSWDGLSTFATPLSGISDPAHWDDEYTAPGATARVPRARFVASHAGRLWTAYVTDVNGVEQPHMVRCSHPNQPERWASYDFHEILGGGGPITAIVPFQDHLLVFKQSSVWAIFGGEYDVDRHQIVNVSRTQGAVSRECVAVSEDAVYFVSWPNGVYRIDGGAPQELSVALRPALDSDGFNKAAYDHMWLGWMDQRLWWSVPYNEDAVADDAASTFVFDPSIGSWTMFRTADGEGLGPFAQGGFGQASVGRWGFVRSSPNVVQVDARDTATDNLTGTAAGFESRYTTRWLNGGWPELKKRWKRPTFMATRRDQEYRLQCTTYVNYDERTKKRKFGVTVSPDAGVITYDDGYLYDDGELYGDGTAGEGTVMRRTSSLGSAVAVQMQIDGEVGKAWGIDGIVFKYRPRRFK